MIRITKSQADQLLSRKATGHTRAPKRKQDLPENQLEQQICDFLRAHGWRLKRNHVGLFVPFRVAQSKGALGHPVRIGETGEPDWTAMRYWRGDEQLIFWEAKAPGKVPTPDQQQYARALRDEGFHADWFDSFTESPDGVGCRPFLNFYNAFFE